MDVIFSDGSRANFEQLIYEAARKAIQDMIPKSSPVERKKMIIDPNRIYSLANPELHELFAVDNLKQPAENIARRLRDAGIDITARRKAGTTVMGYQLVNFFDREKGRLTEYAQK